LFSLMHRNGRMPALPVMRRLDGRMGSAMDLRALFAAPEPVPFSAHTTLSRGDVLDRLGRSIGFHYRTDDSVIRFVVLRGSTADGHVDVIAAPYLTPDLRAKNRPPIALKDKVVSHADATD